MAALVAAMAGTLGLGGLWSWPIELRLAIASWQLDRGMGAEVVLATAGDRDLAHAPHALLRAQLLGRIVDSRADRQADAQRAAQRAVELSPKNGLARLEWALALRRNGDIGGFDTQLQKAAALAPHDPAVGRRILAEAWLDIDVAPPARHRVYVQVAQQMAVWWGYPLVNEAAINGRLHWLCDHAVNDDHAPEMRAACTAQGWEEGGG